MPHEYHLHSHVLLENASRLLSNAFQKSIHFSQVVQISEAEWRNLILRLFIESPADNMPQSIILK